MVKLSEVMSLMKCVVENEFKKKSFKRGGPNRGIVLLAQQQYDHRHKWRQWERKLPHLKYTVIPRLFSTPSRVHISTILLQQPRLPPPKPNIFHLIIIFAGL